MDILNSIYSKTVSQNENNLRFWGEHLKNLESIHLETFSDNLTIPVMVPVGSRILFRGELKHTNEVTVCLGADYFAKCSLKQAEILRQHRIKDAKSKIDLFMKEKQYLENQMFFSKKNIYDPDNKEIFEVYTEDEDKLWRQKHKENVRQYKLQSKNSEKQKEYIGDEELWSRLEELELKEELENELLCLHNNETRVEGSMSSLNTDNSFSTCDINTGNSVPSSKSDSILIKDDNDQIQTEDSCKFDLWQKILNRQNELVDKLEEIKERENNKCKSEEDLLDRLNEIEQLEELEDDIDRLDDIILGEDKKCGQDDAGGQIKPTNKIRHSVTFADEDDSETINITFKHSENQGSNEPYNPENGIQKPSDIYAAFKNNFSVGTSSIIKRTKSQNIVSIDEKPIPLVNKNNEAELVKEDTISNNSTIVIKDVIEKEDINSYVSQSSEKRPTSLFKKKRMQKLH